MGLFSTKEKVKGNKIKISEAEAGMKWLEVLDAIRDNVNKMNPKSAEEYNELMLKEINRLKGICEEKKNHYINN